MLALTASSFSFTLTLIPFAAGCLCFSKSNRSDLDDFMAFSFLYCSGWICIECVDISLVNG